MLYIDRLQEISDDEIQEWNDLLTATSTIDMIDEEDRFQWLRTIEWRKRELLQEKVDEEIDRRHALKMQESYDKIVEDGNVPLMVIDDPEHIRDVMFKRSVGRLVTLLGAKAPEVIIRNELQILVRHQPVI